VKAHVVYWNNIPAPYMVERFNSLARRDNVAFEAWFSARNEEDRSWTVDESSWDFSHRYLPSVEVGRRRVAVPSPVITDRRPDILVAIHFEPGFVPAWAIFRMLGTRVALFVEVTFDSWITRRRWKEMLKGFIFPRVDAILTPGRDGRNYAKRYGARDDQILDLPHVIDFAHYSSRSATARTQRDEIRSELSLQGVTFIYVGRLWRGKGIKYLVDAFALLQRRLPEEVSLLIVGDGSDEPHLRRRCRDEGLRNVAFAGFHQRDVLPRLYAAADVLVFPTLGDPYGLVIEEAMASSLPVITTSSAGEIRDRVDEGVNGFIVSPENSAELLDRMELLSRRPDLRVKMGEEAKRKVATQHPDRWAEQFEEAVRRIISPRESGEAG
jgi:glycosyltransferase involved in cell wall biosynthesis